MTECDVYDELFVQACESVSSLDESDLELPPSQLEKRWETIVKLTQKCKNIRGSAQKNWTAGKLITVCQRVAKFSYELCEIYSHSH